MAHDDTAQTIHQFIERTGLKMSASPLAQRSGPTSDWDKSASHWECIITNPRGYTMRVEYSMGPAHKSGPTLADVLDCLASDASGFDGADSFSSWAADYGYSDDSIKARNIYDTCGAQSKRLRALLGEEYDTLLYTVERM